MNEQIKIGSIIKQIRGVSYKPTDVRETDEENAVALLRANNIQETGLNFDDLVYIDRSIVKSEQYLRAGDILICSSSGSKNLVGKAAYIPEDLLCSFGAFCKVVRTQTVDSYYLGQYFQSPRYRQEISEAAAGANINNIRNEHIDELTIPLHSKSEQMEIVQSLLCVNKQIDYTKQQLAKLDDLVKSRFVEMFGDPVSNEREWNVETLNDVCTEIGDGLHGTPEYDDNGEYPFINGNNLINGAIEITPATKKVNAEIYKKHYIDISANALLLSINGTLGKLAFYNGEKVMLGKSACYCNFKPEINRAFVYGVMKTEAFAGFLEKSATASTIKNVGLKAIRGYKLIMPPQALQMQFIEFSNQVDKSKLVVQQSLEKQETLKKSLMQQYFG